MYIDIIVHHFRLVASAIFSSKELHTKHTCNGNIFSVPRVALELYEFTRT